MQRRFTIGNRQIKWAIGAVIILVLVASATGWAFRRRARADKVTARAVADISLAKGQPDALELSRAAIERIALRSTVIEPSSATEPLKLRGSLYLDPNRLAHVRLLFGGEVVEIGLPATAPAHDASGSKTEPSPLRVGDRVKKDHLLAEVWSREVGERKSDVVDALVSLNLDRTMLTHLKELPKGVVTQGVLITAQRAVEADIIAQDRAERTLRAWRVSDDDIAEVRKEAERLHDGTYGTESAVDRTWAQVDVRAPFDGVIIERNVAVGDIVGTDLDLFVIGDLTELGVVAIVYEEDLPQIEALPDSARRWRITVEALPDVAPIEGPFRLVGKIIDPKQHTGTLMGVIDNSKGRLRVGQFITATVEVPIEPGLMAIPAVAVIEDGTTSSVFVETSHDPLVVRRKRVNVIERGAATVSVRTHFTPEQVKAGFEPLAAGERVVVSGVLELGTELENLQAGTRED